MRAQGAAPGELAGKLRGDARVNGNACNLSHLGLAAHVLRALEAEGVHDLTDWSRLGRKRLVVFGVVPSVVRMLDAAAKAAKEFEG